MATTAGQMSQTPPGDPQWIASDGKYHYGYANLPNPARPATGVSTGRRRDYWRRNGSWAGSRGIGGWLMRVPRDPAGTWFISLADDSGETAIPGAPTPMAPPPGVR